MSGLAEFRVKLPNGGYFYASWPETICAKEIRMGMVMLEMTADYWLDYLDQQAAGEREYRSWFAMPKESSNG